MALSKKQEQDYIEKVKNDVSYLKRIKKNQTETICLEAVRQDGMALEHVKEQTDELCLIALKENGMALKFVENQTPELCWEAIREQSLALDLVENQTEKLCLEAVKNNNDNLNHVHHQTEEICLMSLWQGNGIFDLIKAPTREMEKIHDISLKFDFRSCFSYRDIRYQLAQQRMTLDQSPYHVLEQLYSN